MVIFGAIDFASALAPLAKNVGYRVTIADPRKAFLSSARFTSNSDAIEAWPEEALEGMTLGPRDAVLVFTHDPKLDVPALTAAFATGAGYIGALGSRKTTADREVRLREAGATEADIARVYAPCGLDIGAVDGGGDGDRGARRDRRLQSRALRRAAARGRGLDPPRPRGRRRLGLAAGSDGLVSGVT